MIRCPNMESFKKRLRYMIEEGYEYETIRDDIDGFENEHVQYCRACLESRVEKIYNLQGRL